MKDIPTRYDHNKELDQYTRWETEKMFEPTGQGEPYSIIIPPPNITGDLHMGHALTYGIQDTIARFQRRQGKDVLVLPGMDHAAIAVQALVEKKVQKELGQSRTQLGRDKFLIEVLEWIKHYMPRMEHSLKRFGLSADWNRFRFTMDEHSQEAVRTAFIRLYEKGLIYRGTYLVNWDPKLQTSIADEEVNNQEVAGKLYWIKYGPITVATTRPETKLGDTAIAVSPIDKRYEKYVGKEIEFTNEAGQTQKLPVIADEAVDPEFGTGALKVTPAHDHTDWELGQKHKLPTKQVINGYGKMTDDCGSYAGLKVAEAREKIIADLTKLELIEKITDYKIRQPISERSGAVVEPLPSTQWYLKTTALKDQARKAVKTKGIEFVPKNTEKLYFHWLDNLHDWCISRQLWWGHQLPVWYCQTGQMAKGESLKSKVLQTSDLSPKTSSDNFVVAAEKPDKCPICGECEMKQDEDVLDTWFSSGLWPFSTLGWPLDSHSLARGKPLDPAQSEPSKESDFSRYFPTSLLETGVDIIFFWVSRMIMLSLALTEKIPFKQVYFHGFVLDEKGQKMSKSKGNVLDPLTLIDKYGSDALRMSLIGENSAGTPQRYSEQKIVKYRNFVTKIWNASRFVALETEGAGSELPKTVDFTEEKFFKSLEKLEANNKKQLGELKLSTALENLYEFFWHDFADQFLEYEKKVISEASDKNKVKNAKSALRVALHRQLAMLEDFAPFVVDAIKKEVINE